MIRIITIALLTACFVRAESPEMATNTVELTSGTVTNIMPSDEWFESFRDPNGCFYVYAPCDVDQLEITVPLGIHPCGQRVEVVNGVTNSYADLLTNGVYTVTTNANGLITEVRQ